VGARIWKEHFGKPEAATLQSVYVTTMVKTGSAHGKAKDPWSYEKTDASGKRLLSGFADDPVVNTECADCHEGAHSRDFIYSSHLGDE